MSKNYFLAHDDSIVTLETRTHMQEYLDSLKEDVWSEPYLNEVAVTGIENYPLFHMQQTRNIKAKRNGYTIDLPDINIDVEENMECIEKGNGIFVSFPENGKLKIEPTRCFAWKDLLDRGGMSCPTMLAWNKKENRNPLPVREKADLLTRIYQLFGNRCKILKRYGKISGVKSAGYVILPPQELIPTLENSVREDHPDMKYSTGTVSHEYFTCEYLLNNDMMEDSFLQVIKKAGLKSVERVKAGIRFSTSDVGNSSVMVSCFFTIYQTAGDTTGIRMQLGSSVKMEHKDDASMEKFEELLKTLGSCFKDPEERIEALGNIDITNIGDVIMAIREKYTMFPIEITRQVADEYALKLNPTAIDVYLAFADIIERQAITERNMSPTKYLNLCETAAKFLYLPYSAIDAGMDWKKV